MVKQINKGDDLTAPDVGISVKEAGHRGGTATRDRHGVKFLREIAKKGWRNDKAALGAPLQRIWQAWRQATTIQFRYGWGVPSN